VLVVMLIAPIGPADVYSARLGGVYGSTAAPQVPFAAGHDGVGVVARVGPGVKGALCEGDLVQPAAPFGGTWRAAFVSKARGLTRVGSLAARSTEAAWRAAAGAGGAAAALLCREAAAAAAASSVLPASSPADPALPLEYLAVSRELITAYRLLEMGDLKVGACFALMGFTFANNRPLTFCLGT